MNSSKRVPFHQKHGEFVHDTLQTAKFLISVRYYSQEENEHKVTELTELLINDVLDYAVGAVKYKSTRAKDEQRYVEKRARRVRVHPLKKSICLKPFSLIRSDNE